MDPIGLHCDEMRRRNRRPASIKHRCGTLQRFQKFLNPTPILEASHEQIVEWIFDTRPTCAASQANEVTQLRGFFRWAHAGGLVEVDPTARLSRPSVPRRFPRPFDAHELAVAIGQAPPRIKPWLLLGAYAGLRCMEISQLRAEDLWWAHEPPMILIRESKGGSPSAVPMCRHLVEQLRACDLPERGWLFPRLDSWPGPVPRHRVSQLCNAYFRDLGLSATMHQTRHWFGTEILTAAGGNLRVAQEALRHASIASTQLYTQVRPVQVASAIEKLPLLGTA